MTDEQVLELILIAETKFPDDLQNRWEFLKNLFQVEQDETIDYDFETTDGC
jgi:hypothetical protein